MARRITKPRTVKSSKKKSSPAKKVDDCDIVSKDTKVWLAFERYKLKREVSMFVLNKGLILYFFFMFMALLGYVSMVLTRSLFNIIIIMGLCVLVLGTMPFMFMLRTEEKKIDKIMDENELK